MTKKRILPADIQKIIDSQSPKLLKQEFRKTIVQRVNELKRQMITEFLAHPVTQEIMAGPSTSNSSGTLSGNGNLFAFIGFEKEADPIKPILDRLEEIIPMFAFDIDSGSMFTINFPEIQELFELTPMPWAMGRSWAKGIETGISGLGYFMYQTSGASRSGEGVQVDVKLNKGFRFKNTSYLSPLINKYKKQFLLIK